jgi:type IV pilus assembly protein PilM
VLASTVSRQIVTQYEDLMAGAGLEPNVIDFTSFSLCRFFGGRFEDEGNTLFVSTYGSLLSVFIISNGSVEFFRSKEIPPGKAEDVRLYQEVVNSLLASREKNPGKEPERVFFAAAPHRKEQVGAILSEAAGLDAVWVDFRNMVVPGEGIAADQETAFSLSASIGAGMRNL